MTTESERPRAASEPPAVGTLVRDTRRERVGVVMDASASLLWLRPTGGGREWEAKHGDVRPASTAEELSARVREINHWAGVRL